MSTAQMENYMFNLKLRVKELEMISRRCAKQEKIEKVKCKQAIQKNQVEKARIHAENAVRQNSQSLNFLRMSARVDAIVSRVQSAISSRQVTNNIAGVCKSMEIAMKAMNLETIAKIMDKFEKQFEDTDVQVNCTERTMTDTTATAIPVQDVNILMQAVADEAGLDLNIQLPRGAVDAIQPPAPNSITDQDELSARLARLRMD